MASPIRLPEQCAPTTPESLRTARRRLFALGILLAVVGATWAVQHLWNLRPVTTWPAYVAVFGAYLFAVSFVPDGTAGEWLGLLGGMVTAAGLILATNVGLHASPGVLALNSHAAAGPNYHWEIWFYGWPVVFPFAGLLGLAASAPRRAKPVRRVLAVAFSGLALSLVGALALEGIFHLDGFRFARHIGPWGAIAVLVAGFVILLVIAVLHRCGGYSRGPTPSG